MGFGRTPSSGAALGGETHGVAEENLPVRRSAAEAELERSLSLLRDTLDSTADGILVTDFEGGIVTYNRQFARMWRLPQHILDAGDDDAAIAFVLDQLVDPDGFVTKVRELYERNESESQDVLVFKDGRVFERYSKPHKIGGVSVGRVWSFRDITERRRTEGALLEAEKKYRALVEGIPAVVYLAEFGTSGAWRYVSPRIDQVLGYTPQEWMSDAELWYQRIHPDDRAVARGSETRTRVTGEPLSVEYRMVARDGRVVWVRDEAVVVRDETGTPLFLQGFMHDITERKRAEEELRRQKEELAALHETALGLIRRLDTASVLEAIVSRATTLAGADVGYLYVVDEDGKGEPELVARVGTPLFADYVGSRLRRGEGLAGQVWELGEPVTVQDYSVWKGRHRRFEGMELRAVAGIPLVSGAHVVGVIGVSRLTPDHPFNPEEVELLERFAQLASLALENARLFQSAQLELAERKQAEERYRAIFENAVVGIYQTTLDGRFAAANSALASMFGFDSPQELMDAVTDVIELYADPRDREAFVRIMAHEGTATMLEYRIRRRDGVEAWVQENARALVDAAGELVGFEGTLIDVTERKQAEEALRTAYERERLAADRLRTVDELKNAFMAAVSHELRTPLASIMGFAVTLEREELTLTPEESREIRRRLAFNARKLDRLLSDLLDLDRLNRGIIEPRCHSTDVGELVRRTVEDCDFLGSHEVTLEVESLILSVDGPKLERIVENLLANAAKHTPPGTHLWVRLRPKDDGMLLVVEDDGPGVPDHFKQRIFQPFNHGQPVAHAPGTGIGLSLVDQFARLHGGRTWVQDRRGGGASFHVHIPASR